MVLLVVEKALAVGDQILKVADLRPVHRRKIDFGDDAVPERKPDSAGSCIGGSQPILSSVRPAGLDARPSKSLLVGLHYRSQSNLSLKRETSKRRQNALQNLRHARGGRLQERKSNPGRWNQENERTNHPHNDRSQNLIRERRDMKGIGLREVITINRPIAEREEGGESGVHDVGR